MVSIVCAVTDCIHPVASSFCLLAFLQVTKESTDEFVGRMQGYLMLYAAVMQVRMMPGSRWCAVCSGLICTHLLRLPLLRQGSASPHSAMLASRWLAAGNPLPPLPAFIALLLQSDNPQNPHGLGHAWALLARLLNALPANRVTATAVDALLKVRAVRGCWGGRFSGWHTTCRLAGWK